NGNSKSTKVYNLPIGKRNLNWRQIAAAVAVIALVSASVFYFSIKSKNNHSIAIEKPIHKDIIAPNSVNAVITLSNGKRIILDSAGNGVLAQQGAVKVMKLANGEIAYNSLSDNI